MKDWVILTVAASVASSLFTLLLSESESKKAFRTLCGVVLMLVIILPLSGMSDELSDFDFEKIYDDFSVSFSESSEDVVYTAVKTGYENLLKEKLMKDYSAIDNIRVEVLLVNEVYELKKVEILLRRSVDNSFSIADEIRSITRSDCEVVFIDEF